MQRLRPGLIRSRCAATAGSSHRLDTARSGLRKDRRNSLYATDAHGVRFQNIWLAATLVVLGIVGLYITQYDRRKEAYSREGERLTKLFYRLRDLYREVESKADGDDLSTQRAGETKQLLFSDWYAHYKFFGQHQIEWADEQKHFRFWRDKLPLSFILTVGALLLGLAAGTFWFVFGA